MKEARRDSRAWLAEVGRTKKSLGLGLLLGLDFGLGLGLGFSLGLGLGLLLVTAAADAAEGERADDHRGQKLLHVEPSFPWDLKNYPRQTGPIPACRESVVGGEFSVRDLLAVGLGSVRFGSVRFLRLRLGRISLGCV